MSAHDAYLGGGFTGEFESEVTLPVRVRYAVDADGAVEITYLCLANATTDNPRPLLWRHLPLPERRALEREAEAQAKAARE